MEADAPDELSLAGLEAESLHELRRAYHDRIADLRSAAHAIVAESIDGAATATTLLLGDDEPPTVDPGRRPAVVARVAAVEAEVLALLALEAPVARDLRVILSARDIAHLGELCVGLTLMLKATAGRARDELTPELREMLGQIGQEAVDLLQHANGAWATLDSDQAQQVLPGAQRSRDLLRTFFAEVIRLTAVPVDAAIALSRTLRAYERLTDHAVEIADRVLFAVNGTSSGLTLDALGS